MKQKATVLGTDCDAICAIVSALHNVGEFAVAIRPMPGLTYRVESLPNAENATMPRSTIIVREVYCAALEGSAALWSVRSGPTLAMPSRL